MRESRILSHDLDMAKRNVFLVRLEFIHCELEAQL